MKKTKEEAAETRNKLLEAGLNVFSRKGFSATTLVDIAAEAGVTRGAVYWHFKDKEELYWELNQKYNMLFFGKINDFLHQDMNAIEKLQVIINYLFTMLEESPEFRMIEEINHIKSECLESCKSLHGDFKNQKDQKWMTVKNIIDQGIAEGIIRRDIDSESITSAIVGYVFGLEVLWLHDPQAFSIKGRCEDLIKVLLKGVTA